MTEAERRVVFDPFFSKEVEVSDKLTDRLCGRYARGPTMPNGEPEFGWFDFNVPPIQREAADRIEQLERLLGECEVALGTETNLRLAAESELSRIRDVKELSE